MISQLLDLRCTPRGDIWSTVGLRTNLTLAHVDRCGGFQFYGGMGVEQNKFLFSKESEVVLITLHCTIVHAEDESVSV